MSAQDATDVVRRAIEGFDFDLVADDVQWRIAGTHRFAGLYDGKADVMERLIGPLGSVLESFGSVVIDSMTAEDDRVAVQSHAIDRVTKTGVPYNNTYFCLYRVADGKVVEIDEYCDTELITAVFGRAAATA
jgi:ketosteroid isomerase-like protein